MDKNQAERGPSQQTNRKTQTMLGCPYSDYYDQDENSCESSVRKYVRELGPMSLLPWRLRIAPALSDILAVKSDLSTRFFHLHFIAATAASLLSTIATAALVQNASQA